MNSTMTQNEKMDLLDLFSKVIMGSMLLGVYGIGVYLHVKVIQVSKKEKELTWKMDISNSVILLICSIHSLFMHTLTYFVSDLHTITGKWYCYLIKALYVIGSAHTTGHSFVIAVIKYVIIVHYQSTITGLKKEKVKSIFFWINLFYPVAMFAVLCMITPDFIFIYDGVSPANRCLGKSEIFSSLKKNSSAVKLHNLCNIDAPNDLLSYKYAFFIVRKSICWVHIIFLYANVWNLIELIIYVKIFKFMHR